MPPRKEENAEKNQMTLWKHDYYHQSQSYELLEGDGMAHAHQIFLYFILTKTKMPLELNVNNEKPL
jgi:hypothetical protein